MVLTSQPTTKPTLVLGASEKRDRYSNIAARMLLEYNHEIYLLGRRAGIMDENPIVTEWPEPDSIDTVTLYVNPRNQEVYQDKILDLNPRRVIFNPGTENPAFYKDLREKGIEVEIACTLVMLRAGMY